MSDTVHSLSTSGLTPKKQIQCLVRCTDGSLRPVRRRSAGGFVVRRTDQLHDRFAAEALPDRGEPASDRAHGFARARLSEHPYVKILFQTYGISYFEQDGRRIEIMPGDCLAYDVSCPHTIVSPSLTRGTRSSSCRRNCCRNAASACEDVAVQAFGAHRHRPDRL